MNPKDPVSAVRKLMTIGNAELLGPMIDRIDILKFGSDLLQSACTLGKADIVKYLLEKGADIYNPPDSIVGEESYRSAPFMLMAAASGDVETLEAVINAGGSISDCGFITLSKKRKNHVISNVIG